MGSNRAWPRRSTGGPLHSLRCAPLPCCPYDSRPIVAVFVAPIRPGVVPGRKPKIRSNTMSDTNETNRPTHNIFQVIGDGENAIWIRVGAAWLHKDERGAHLVFNSFPLTGKIVMRERNDREA